MLSNTLLQKLTAEDYKVFNHNLITIEKLKSVTDDQTGKRLYQTPSGKAYPSVTTVLSETKKDHIHKWRKRVGEKEANRITTQATKRGTSVHALCEAYIHNELHKYDKEIIDVDSFLQIKAIVDKYVDNVRLVESTLYSDYLEVGGTVDLIAEFDGRLSVIDFKTSLKPKKKEWIDNYFMQASAYCVMMEERTGIPVGRIAIIIAVDGHEPQLFLEKRNDHIHQFMRVRQAYKEKFNV